MLWLCVHIILYALVTRWAIWWWRWKKAVYMTPGQCPAFLLSPARSLRPNVFRFICLLLAENVRKTPDSEREQKQHTQWMCAGNGYWAAVIPTTATTTHTKSEREREKKNEAFVCNNSGRMLKIECEDSPFGIGLGKLRVFGWRGMEKFRMPTN